VIESATTEPPVAEGADAAPDEETGD